MGDPLVVNFINLTWEHPLVANFVNLVQDYPLVATKGINFGKNPSAG